MLRNDEFDWGDLTRATSSNPLKQQRKKPNRERPFPSGKDLVRPVQKTTPLPNPPPEPEMRVTADLALETQPKRVLSPLAPVLKPVVPAPSLPSVPEPVAEKTPEPVLAEEPIEVVEVPIPTSTTAVVEEPIVVEVPEPTPTAAVVEEPIVVEEPAPIPTSIVKEEPALESTPEPVVVKKKSLKIDEQPGLAAVRPLPEEPPPVEPADDEVRPVLYYKTVTPQTASQDSSLDEATVEEPAPISTAVPEVSPAIEAAVIVVESEPVVAKKPAALYYKDSLPSRTQTPAFDIAPEMKSSNYSRSPGGTPSPAASKVAPTNTTVASGSAPARANGITDYQKNIERQSREQKSVGSLLSILVYGILTGLLLVAGLAGYGLYVLNVQIHQQSVTVDDLQRNFTNITNDLKTKLDNTQADLDKANAEISRHNDLIIQEQEDLNQLIKDETAAIAGANAAIAGANTAINNVTSSISRERGTRQSNEDELEDRIHKLEARVAELRTSITNLHPENRPPDSRTDTH